MIKAQDQQSDDLGYCKVLICQYQLTVLAPPKAGAVREPEACLLPRTEQVLGFLCLLRNEELLGGPSKIICQWWG